ncbi:3-oxoacyl-[acyl-carrier-protein] synthase III [Renibacterium salmoninarum ATCC 33209]|uniref:3-oxoacyl-[acyl-carrier-protein] synthase III n=1 Tax=Renibacterium salmoninarum (strain ATCC 33209 / DSM 20767 / JCM 11484 / NBRC 15589 / NCIMB 2235) TaxID=288705 RepID=A9WV03_RENSM|nr:3-oxoacyl-[acyl-carrier-protein] synthase III [Renibacterium salmoninarum ATCC 33209]
MSWLKDLLYRRQRLVVVVSLGFVFGGLVGGGLSWAEGIEWRDAAAASIQVDPGNLPGGPSSHIRQTTALALLQTLPVKGRAPKNAYKREQFGLAWTDADRNGCDTRN